MGAHSRQIGDIAVTALSDGVLATGLDVVLGIDKAEAERLAGKTAGEPVDIAVNAFLLELNGRYVLVDAGSGNTLGPTLGKLTDSLRAIGVAPERIDTILLTHVHSDHSNVLVDDDGRAVYPNAQLVLHEAEAAFWLDRDEASGANERIRRNIAKARVTTAPIASACARCVMATRCRACRRCCSPATPRAIPAGASNRAARAC